MITGVLSYLSKHLASRTSDKTLQLQLSVRDLTSMLNSLDALAGKLSPVSTNLVGANSTSGPNTNTSSGLDSNANRVHPYLKQGSTSNNNNNNNNSQIK